MNVRFFRTVFDAAGCLALQKQREYTRAVSIPGPVKACTRLRTTYTAAALRACVAHVLGQSLRGHWIVETFGKRGSHRALEFVALPRQRHVIERAGQHCIKVRIGIIEA